jgi:hypothetical protein
MAVTFYQNAFLFLRCAYSKGLRRYTKEYLVSVRRRRRTNDNFVHIHVSRLLECKSHSTGDGGGRQNNPAEVDHHLTRTVIGDQAAGSAPDDFAGSARCGDGRL